MTKEKTDWMWVIQMLTMGAFGLAMCYQAQVIGMLWERVDDMQLKIDLMHDELIDTPPIFEKMGVNKDEQISE